VYAGSTATTVSPALADMTSNRRRKALVGKLETRWRNLRFRPFPGCDGC
jgi:hypothetical protein